MRIIDRYLLRQFVQTFLICFLSLIGLFVVIDLFTNLEHFVTAGREAGGVMSFIAQYYMYKTIPFFDRTGGLLALVSAMFTVSWIQRHNEMTALMAAGVSRFRVLLPIIIAVAVVSLILAANREILMPRYRHEFSRHPQDPSGSKPQSLGPRYDGRTNVSAGRQVQLTPTNKRIEEPSFRMPPSLYALRQYVDGRQRLLQTARGQTVRADICSTACIGRRTSTPGRHCRLNGRTGAYHSVRRPVAQAGPVFSGERRGFRPIDGGEEPHQLSSTAQLIRGLRNPSLDYGAKEKVAIHARLVQPLLDMTLLFLGLPLVVTRESRNVFVAMGICMAVTTAFTLVVMGAQDSGGFPTGSSPPRWRPGYP